MTLSFEDFKLHRQQVIEDEGMYACILNQNGEHVIDLPPIKSLNSSILSLGHSDITAEVDLDIEDDEYIHKLCDDLIGDNFSIVIERGKLKTNADHTRLLLIEDKHGREVYLITIPELTGDNNEINTLSIKGSSLTYYLETLPAPSNLKSWRQAQFHMIDRDWAQELSKPRMLAEIQLADVADGFSEAGKADETIIKILKDSVETVNQAMGWTDSHIYISEHKTGVESPEVKIRITDDSLWTTIADYALYAGISIELSFWIPGDEAVDGNTWTTPKIIVRVNQREDRSS